MSARRTARLLAVGGIALLLSGCNPFSEARPMMDDYVERVGRVLDIAPQLSEIPPAQQIPRRRYRVLSMPELELGMLDFLSLYGCELQVVVGEKNSVMGKVMQPLNRLRYEVRFIQTARQCVETVEEEELQNLLEQAIASKRESLPIAVWNATFGVEEIESLFSLAKGAYPVDNPGAVSDLGRDAQRLNTSVARLLERDLAVNLGFWGEVHQRWQGVNRAGQLINSAHLVSARLDDATRVIRQRLDGRPLCLNGKPNNQSDIVQSMFFSIYIGKVQPYLAELQRARQTLIAPLSELAAMQSGTMPDPFQAWYHSTLALEGSASVWVKLGKAMRLHTESWQALLEQCGLRPGV